MTAIPPIPGSYSLSPVWPVGTVRRTRPVERTRNRRHHANNVRQAAAPLLQVEETAISESFSLRHNLSRAPQQALQPATGYLHIENMQELLDLRWPRRDVRPDLIPYYHHKLEQWASSGHNGPLSRNQSSPA